MKKIALLVFFLMSSAFSASAEFNGTGGGYVQAIMPWSSNSVGVNVTNSPTGYALNSSFVLDRSSMGSLNFDMTLNMLQAALLNQKNIYLQYTPGTCNGFNGQPCLGTITYVGLRMLP